MLRMPGRQHQRRGRQRLAAGVGHDRGRRRTESEHRLRRGHLHRQIRAGGLAARLAPGATATPVRAGRSSISVCGSPSLGFMQPAMCCEQSRQRPGRRARGPAAGSHRRRSPWPAAVGGAQRPVRAADPVRSVARRPLRCRARCLDRCNLRFGCAGPRGALHAGGGGRTFWRSSRMTALPERRVRASRPRPARPWQRRRNRIGFDRRAEPDDHRRHRPGHDLDQGTLRGRRWQCCRPRVRSATTDPAAARGGWSMTLRCCSRDVRACVAQGARPAQAAALGQPGGDGRRLGSPRAAGRSANAIVWQDQRTGRPCRRSADAGRARGRGTERSGLPLDAYFSASKLRWLLDEMSGCRRLVAAGASRPRHHRRIVPRAPDRSLRHRRDHGVADLADEPRPLRTGTWCFAACSACRSSCCRRSSNATATDRQSCPGAGLPLLASVVDQVAALYGHGCARPGDAKMTFGTGAFALAMTEGRAVDSGGRRGAGWRGPRGGSMPPTEASIRPGPRWNG